MSTRHQEPKALLRIGIRAAEKAMRGKSPGKATYLAGERAAASAILKADPQAGTSTHKYRSARYSAGVNELARRARILAQRLLWTGDGKQPSWASRIDRDARRARRTSRRDPGEKRTRSPRRPKTPKLHPGTTYAIDQLRHLGVKEGYVVKVKIGPYDHNEHDMVLPDQQFPKVFRALYEAVDYAREMHRRGYGDPSNLVIVRIGEGGPYGQLLGTVVWRYKTDNARDARRSRRRSRKR